MTITLIILIWALASLKMTTIGLYHNRFWILELVALTYPLTAEGHQEWCLPKFQRAKHYLQAPKQNQRLLHPTDWHDIFKRSMKASHNQGRPRC